MATPIRTRDLIDERRAAQRDLARRIRRLPAVPDHIIDLLDEIIDPEKVPRAPDPLLRPSISAIKVEVISAFEISRQVLEGPSRSRDAVRPRQIAMYLSSRLAGRSLPQIGRAFGGRDHATALHAVRKVESLISTDPDFKARVDQIASRFISS